MAARSFGRLAWQVRILATGALLGCSADPGERALAVGGPTPAPGMSQPAPAPPPPAAVPLPEHEPPSTAASQPEPAAGEALARAEREPVIAPSSEADPDVAPSVEPAPPATPATPETSAPVVEVLVAMAREVFVYERPRFDARKLGYLRWGARVTRGHEPVGYAGCKGGFYRVAPEGYVCAGASARPERGEATADATAWAQERTAALPYVYAKTRAPGTPLYVKLPSEVELKVHEPGLTSRAASSSSGLGALTLSPLPDALANGGSLLTPFGYPYSEGTVLAGHANFPSTLALLGVFEHDRRKYALTTDRSLVPLDRLESVKPSGFQGISLRESGLPVAFVMKHAAYLYAGRGAQRRPVRPLAYREALPLSGKTERSGGVTWLETRAHDWIVDDRLVRLDAPRTLPSWAKNGRTWISVSVERQALIAFEGEVPVYATLVSTGIDGLGDPETTRSTVRGQFLIHTKHVSATMDSDELGDEYDLRDVPFVQYFKDGYALHAALWHDAFGTPRSHGCINLSPVDARWLFRWTDPPVPPAWHGAFSLREGTLIDIGP